MTHVPVHTSWPTEPLGRIENILTDGCGSVEAWDFSLANSSYETRVQAVTKVASICYGNPKALGSISLFDRLQAEAAGLPSSSYEFVPVLLSVGDVQNITDTARKLYFKDDKVPLPHLNIRKFGEYVCKTKYLLTNLRALIADVGPEESLKYLNTSPEEIQIIKDNFKVYLFNVDLATRAQMVRHRCSWQELSRRYVSGKKTPFDFYISEKLSGIEHESCDFGKYSTEYIIQTCVAHYNYAISIGVKPEEARRILPQSMMTTIWGAFQPTQLANFFTLRLDSHAQREIRLVAEAMKELV